MSKIFYDHLVVRQDVISQLDAYAMDAEEKEELVKLIDEHLHHQILNVILNHLPKDKHERFITHLTRAPHDPALLDYLKTHIAIDIETEIKSHAAKVKADLLSEIHKSKTKHHPTR